MAHYLRDARIENVTLDEAKLRELAAVFQDLRARVIVGLDEQEARKWFLSYTIRYDRQGHRVYDLEEAMRYYSQASHIERFIIGLESEVSLRTSRAAGAFAELRFDALSPENCWLISTSDVKADTDAAYAAIEEPLRSAKNRNAVARGSLARATIQLLGVLAAFAISLWGAGRLADHLRIESAFPITLLFLFVIVGNIWSFIHPALLQLVDRLFPNIHFERAGKERWHWLWRAIVSGAVWTILLAIVLKVFAYVAESLAPFFVSNP